MLLVGVDAGVGRRTFLTDTMIVVSLDPVAGTVSMLSIPRDMVDVPLPDGTVFPAKINGLVSWARHNPGQFPGADGRGYDVLMGALGTLLDVRIDLYAQVTLGGFVSVVDRLGGVDVNVRRAFCDPRLPRVRLPERLLDHGRPAPPGRPGSAGVCACPQGIGRIGLHPCRPPAGDPVRDPRRHRPRPVPPGPGRVA